MKKLLVAIICAFGLQVFAVVQIKCYFAPPVVQQNMPFDLVIESDGNSAPRLFSEIEGIKYVSIQSSTVMDGTTSQSRTVYTCETDLTGTIEIPALDIKVGSEMLKSEPMKLTIEKLTLPAIPASGEILPTSSVVAGTPDKWKLVSLIGVLPQDRPLFYVGELIPLELRFFIQPEYARLMLIEYPDMALGKAIITDFSPINRRNSSFAPLVKENVKIGGVNYTVVSFKTSFRPLAAGIVKLAAEQVFKLETLKEYRVFSQRMNYEMPSITVEPVPAPPKGSYTLNLLGTWSIKAEQNVTTVNAGNPVNLTITITGEGALDGVKAPVISIPNCRIYPPELKTYEGYNWAQLTYVIIPLSEGKIDDVLNFATFSPKDGKYVLSETAFRLTVAKGSVAQERFVPPDDEVSTEIEPEKSPLELQSTLKFKRSGNVTLPIWQNKIWFILIVLLTGPMVWIAVEWRRYRIEKCKEDSEWRRRKRASKRRSSVFSAVRKAKDDEIVKVINQTVVPFLNDAFNYPPGSGASEIAGLTRDKELAELLNQTAGIEYLPKNERVAHTNGELRGNLLRILKKMTIVVFIFSVFPLSALETNSWNKACDVLLSENPAAAVADFEAMLNIGEVDAAIAFNLGVASFNAGNYPLSLWAFELAHLLDPRDVESVDSLNALRRRFFITEAGSTSNTKNMIVSLRDSFRPDEYFAAASLAVLVIFILLLFRRRIGRWQSISSIAVFAFISLFLSAAAMWQLQTSYNPGRAVIIKNQAMLRTLPSDSVAGGGIPLQGGDSVVVIGEHDGFKQIKSGKNSGYVRNDEIKKLL